MDNKKLDQFKSDIKRYRPHGYQFEVNDKQLETLYYLCINLSRHPSDSEPHTPWNWGQMASKILRFFEEEMKELGGKND
jgi:hypothetical protein